jgi:hypothetical protein
MANFNFQSSIFVVISVTWLHERDAQHIDKSKIKIRALIWDRYNLFKDEGGSVFGHDYQKIKKNPNPALGQEYCIME